MALTYRAAVAAAAVGIAMMLLPDQWRSIPDRIDVGPWAPPGPVVVMVAAILVIAMIDAALARTQSIEITRSMPSSIATGVQTEVSWEVTNLSRRRQRVSFADELAPSLRAGARRSALTVPANASATVTTSIHPVRRGRFEIGEIAHRLEGPLGVGARQWTVTTPSTLQVVAPFRSRSEAELRINSRRVLEAGLRSAKGRGAGTEFDQLREYGPDDEYRRIDWAATARSARPIVRTYRAEKNQRVVCLVDNGRVMAGRVADVPRVEHAIDAAMTLTAVSTGLGDKCGLVTFDRAVRTVLAPSARRNQLQLTARALFELDPVLAESDYRTAFATVAARFNRRAMLVVLTDLVVQAVEASLLPALPLIARSHLVVVGAVRDPEVVAWATNPATDAEEAHRKAAAIESLADRATAIARLERQGAVVVDAEPGKLGTDIADAYLGFKSTGRL